VRLTTSPGTDLTILLAPGEKITNIRLNDYARYQVTIAQGRDSLVVHTSPVTYPGGSVPDGSMQVTSDARAYAFVLSAAAPDQPTAYVLRFTYAHSARAGHRSAKIEPQYRIFGNREVRPSAIRDDGAKTFIEWPADAAIPAVFALEHRREEMVNGFVRGGVFTIDRVHQHLVFRIDKLQAEAVRRSDKSAS
jgi:type IV secretion system protein VirB9